jgi:hypothetical protein
MPEAILFTADSNVAAGNPDIMPGGIDVTRTTPAFPATCGDHLTVRVRLQAISPPGTTHWYFRLTTP